MPKVCHTASFRGAHQEDVRQERAPREDSCIGELYTQEREGIDSRGGMDPVQASIVVDSARERVFDYLQDIANHSQFTDHYLVDWRLTRTRSVGVGAGARFRVKAPGNRFGWAGVSIAEVQRPHRIVEVGRGGKSNRIRTLGVYELAPGAGGTTRITFTFQTEPEKLSDKLMEALGGRIWIKRQNAKAMRRLRAIVEGQKAGGARVTVAAR